MEQRQHLPDIDHNEGNSYEPIMLQIQSFFGITTDLRTSIHNIDKTYWIIEVSSLNKLNFLIEYLNNYPLLTAKQNDYDDWVRVYQLIEEKKHLTEKLRQQGRSQRKLLIKEIKSNMNNKRKVFNWDHLIYLNKIQ